MESENTINVLYGYYLGLKGKNKTIFRKKIQDYFNWNTYETFRRKLRSELTQAEEDGVNKIISEYGNA
jgi:hypothetical protein